MASFVYYKFRSQKNESRIQFEGTGISVFNLKREILVANKFSRANDFDLALYDQHDQEYKDDTTIIPRLSSVIVRRLPATGLGRGTAARYLPGVLRPASTSSSASFRGPSGSKSKRFDPQPNPASSPVSVRRPARANPLPAETRGVSETSSTPPSLAGDEAAGIAAMFAATEHHWEETKEKMSYAVRVPLSSTRGGPGSKAYVPHSQSPQQDLAPRPTPPGYICYRCGQKGHWIQDCPTKNDRKFDNRPRLKRTTGIPRSFLKAVDQPEGSLTAGVMITREGGYVVAQPDAASWRKQTMRRKTLNEADVRARPPSDASLACPLCSRLFCEPVRTPCCGAVYCEECIQTHLLEYDLECLACHYKIPSLDKLVPQEAVVAHVQAHIGKVLAESRAASSNGEQQLEADGGKPSRISEALNDGLTDDIYNNESMPEEQQLFPKPAQIQAQIGHFHMMLKDPGLSQQARVQLQMQLPQLTSQLELARIVATLAEAALASASASYDVNVPPINMAGMGMSGSHNVMTPQPVWNSSDHHPQWTNPFPSQQPVGPESAYERLPVNNRPRGLKRTRPCDFLELGGDGPTNKITR